MDDGCWNLEDIREGDFDQLAIYRVPDQHVEKGDSRFRAEASLPRNLALLKEERNNKIVVSFEHCFNEFFKILQWFPKLYSTHREAAKVTRCIRKCDFFNASSCAIALHKTKFVARQEHSLTMNFTDT